MSPWSDVVPATLVAVLLLIAPGGVSAFVAGARGPALLALAGPASIAIVAGTGVIAGATGIPFGPVPVAVGTVLAVTVAWAVRRWLPRSPDLEAGSVRDVPIIAIAAAVSMVVTALIAFGDVASPDLISQTYDGVFHVNAVASVLQTGDASSFHLYRVTHPGDGIEFYPAAWHGLVALVVMTTGSSIGLAANAVWIAMTGAVFALGSSWLASLVVPGGRRSTLVLVVAAVTGSAIAAGPYLLLQWGVLYPTGLAYALMPSGLALTVVVLRRLLHTAVLVPALWLAVWLAASAFAHPRSLISFALLLLPLLIGTAMGWARRGLADPARRRGTIIGLAAGTAALLVTAAAGSFAILRYFGADARPISDRLNGGPATARQGFVESVVQGLLMAPPSGSGGVPLPVTVVIGAAVVVALVIALRMPSIRWVAVAYLLTVALYALAAGSNSDFAKLTTGLWYKDKFRLFAMLGVLAPPLLAAVTAWATAPLARVRKLGRSGAQILAGLLAVLVIAAGWFGPTLNGMRAAVAGNYALSATKEGGRLLDIDEVALIEELSSLTPPGSVIVGNPWNGSTLSWAVGGREALFPHLTGEWDPDRLFIQQWVDRVTLDPAICAALDRMDAHYLLDSKGLLWGGDPQAQEFAAVDRAATAPGFELIAQRGDNRLFRITACD